MTSPLIGLTMRRAVSKTGLPSVVLLQAYIDAIVQAGGTPLLIPSDIPAEDWDGLLSRLDGIVLTGGGDIATERFHGQDHPEVCEVDEQRDSIELGLLRAAAASRIPFLGICRGLQVVNVALGGTLYTHIPDQYPNAVRHDFDEGYPRSYLAHSVRIQAGSQLAQIVGELLLQVNSLHYQGVKELAPGLQTVAVAPDGLVEALELPGHPFGVAVQWHPEWLTGQESTRRLFRAFIVASLGKRDG